MAFAAENLNYIKHLQQKAVNFTTSRRGNSEVGGGDGEAGNYTSSSESNEFIAENYPGILESDLTALTQTERVVFIVTVSILFLLSLCGNIGTLHVNFRRKIRPFFRACLISLALSDLLNTCFLTVAYLGQFISDYVQVWLLGQTMCNLVPFATTTAILASSMTLVGIALDRYFAVTKAVIAFWNPGVVLSMCCMLGVWTASIAISFPVYCVYNLYTVYVLEEDPLSSDILQKGSNEPSVLVATRTPREDWASKEDMSYILVQEVELVQMCVSNQRRVAIYYIIIFNIIFVPCIIAFLWLNTVIARKLWQRRHTAARHKCSRHDKKSSKQSRSKSPSHCGTQHHSADHILSAPKAALDATIPCNVTETFGGASAQPPQDHATSAHDHHTSDPHPNQRQKSQSSRETRHVRMFTIIVLLIAVFLFLRLPAWIFLILRMYGSYSRSPHWIIYFSFGILNLTSCVLNPLSYTFLGETIQCVTYFKVRVIDDFCGLRICCERCQQRHAMVSTCPDSDKPHQCWGRCSNFWRWLDYIWKRLRWQKKISSQSDASAPPPQWRPSTIAVKIEHALDNNEMDEGVDCSDLSDISEVEGSSELYCYTKRIYTIFPDSLVSCSITSEYDKCGNFRRT